MDISFVFTALEDICKNNICLTHKEVFSSIFGGILTGLSAIIIYIMQKRMEGKTNKYNTAIMLHGEVKRIIRVSELNETVYNGTNVAKRLPTYEIYQGLLYSGDIKYFESVLQNKLDEACTVFRNHPLNPDIKLGLDIMHDLEQIIKNNRRYIAVFHITKFLQKQ